MATSTYLSNPVVTVNAVDVTDQTSAANLTRVIEALESTSFGKTSRVYVSGLENSTLTLTMYNSFCCVRNLRNIVSIGWHIHQRNHSTNERRDQRHEPNFDSDWLLPRNIANRQRRTRRTRHH